MDMGMMTMDWPMMLLGVAAMALLVAALVAGIVWLVRASQPQHDGAVQSSALEQLRARYARGEIDREEYLLKESDLADGPG